MADDLAARIRRVREQADLTQEQFARLAGTDMKTVSNWENGRTRPQKLHKLLDVLEDLEGRQPGRLRAVDEPNDDPDENATIAAILRDPYLLPEAKAHFLNQYELLLRIARRADDERLPYAARGRRKTEIDPDEEARIERVARDAAEANPHFRDRKK